MCESNVNEYGWTVETEGPPLTRELNICFSPSFLNEGETCIDGEEMLRRGRASVQELGPLAGRQWAKALVGDQQMIPVGLRGVKRFVFAGSVLKDKDKEGHRFVPCVLWDGDCWVEVYCVLDTRSWDGSYHLAHLSPA